MKALVYILLTLLVISCKYKVQNSGSNCSFCYLSYSDMNICDTCDYVLITGRYKKNLKYACDKLVIKNLESINRRKVTLPSKIISQDSLKILSLSNCKNDSIIKQIRSLLKFYYKSRVFNKDLLNLDGLYLLGYSFSKGDYSKLISDTNFTLRHLYLGGKKSHKFDSSLLYFPNLITLGGNFNLFDDENFNIYSKLDSLVNISVHNYSFTKTNINKYNLDRLKKYKIDLPYYAENKFTKSQIELLKKYKNIKIHYRKVIKR